MQRNTKYCEKNGHDWKPITIKYAPTTIWECRICGARQKRFTHPHYETEVFE